MWPSILKSCERDIYASSGGASRGGAGHDKAGGQPTLTLVVPTRDEDGGYYNYDGAAASRSSDESTSSLDELQLADAATMVVRSFTADPAWLDQQYRRDYEDEGQRFVRVELLAEANDSGPRSLRGSPFNVPVRRGGGDDQHLPGAPSSDPSTDHGASANFPIVNSWHSSSSAAGAGAKKGSYGGAAPPRPSSGIPLLGRGGAAGSRGLMVDTSLDGRPRREEDFSPTTGAKMKSVDKVEQLLTVEQLIERGAGIMAGGARMSSSTPLGGRSPKGSSNTSPTGSLSLRRKCWADSSHASPSSGGGPATSQSQTISEEILEPAQQVGAKAMDDGTNRAANHAEVLVDGAPVPVVVRAVSSSSTSSSSSSASSVGASPASTAHKMNAAQTNFLPTETEAREEVPSEKEPPAEDEEDHSIPLDPAVEHRVRVNLTIMNTAADALNASKWVMEKKRKEMAVLKHEWVLMRQALMRECGGAEAVLAVEKEPVFLKDRELRASQKKAGDLAERFVAMEAKLDVVVSIIPALASERNS